MADRIVRLTCGNFAGPAANGQAIAMAVNRSIKHRVFYYVGSAGRLRGKSACRTPPSWVGSEGARCSRIRLLARNGRPTG
jgi:hypothetical protein